MKRILFITSLLLTGLYGQLLAQSDSTENKVKQLGLGLTGFNNFQLLYHWGDSKKVFRLSGSYLNHKSSQKSVSTFPDPITTKDPSDDGEQFSKTSTEQLNVSLSRLKFRKVNEKVHLVHGPMISIGSYFYSNKSYVQDLVDLETWGRRGTYIIEPSIGAGYVIGAGYTINEHLQLFIDLSPQLYASFSRTISANNNKGDEDYRTYTTTYFDYGVRLNNSGAKLSLFFNLTK